ncbi:MAG TPA: hypothetical protein VMS88_01340 [Terriglobales bacterium]|nr:hypothetical protein [Terriglobales bacterium]
MKPRAPCRIAAVLLALASVARAQDFGSAAPPGPADAPCAFIESGLPPSSIAGAEAAFTRWFALPDLETRAIAAAAGIGALRVAAGVSQTGEAGIGWNAAGAALGVVRERAGVALRAVARRDRTIAPGSEAALHLEDRAGLEAGGGAWLAPAENLIVWASVPQAWAGGTAPPLDRPMELGARYAIGDSTGRGGLAFWVARGAPSGDAPADHAAGAMLRSGPLAAWATVRDRPLRGGFGLSARARWLVVSGEVESHPDLGETVRVGIALLGSPP